MLDLIIVLEESLLLLNSLLKLWLKILTKLLFALYGNFFFPLRFLQSANDLFVSSLQVSDTSVLFRNLFVGSREFVLNVLSQILALVLLSQAILVSSVGFVQYLNLNMKFLNLLTESLLHGIRVQETLDFLFAKEEFFLDHGLHVGVGIDDGF